MGEPMETGQDDPKITGTTRERIYATIYGQCIGDAVGIIAKYMGKEKLEQTLQRNGILEYSQGCSDTCKIPWAAGDWTDDSAQMILMMQSLIDNGGQIIQQDIDAKLLHWKKHGFNEFRDSCGSGNDKVTGKARKAKCVTAPSGCVAQTSILGIHKWWKTEDVVKNVYKTTQYDTRYQAAAVAFAVAISLMLQTDSNIYENGECQVDVLTKEVYKYAMKCLATEPEQRYLRQCLDCRDISQLRLQDKESDVFKCLGVGFWALKQKNFREALQEIVLCGGDANINGAVAGALLGCKLGHENYFPEFWLKLKHKEWLDGNIERFIAMSEIYKQTHVEQLEKNADMKDIEPPVDHLGNTSNAGRKPSLPLIKHLNRDLQEQIRATLYGQCIGDAIGLLTEFMTKEEAKKHYSKRLPLEYSYKIKDEHRVRWENGDWTDDSDQMFLIMQSLIDNEGEVINFDFAERMVQWMKNGFKKCGDKGGLGIGNTTYTILLDSKFTQDPHQAAQDQWLRGNKDVAPNGGVMRTSVLGVHDWWETRMVKKNALDICKTTHRDPRCQASAVAVSVAISLMLQRKHYNGNHLNVNHLINEVYEYASSCLETQDQKKELSTYLNCTDLQRLKLDEKKYIGYTYKCMGAGFWALKQENFQKALTAIVMCGGDADTNGAVAGALLGCKLGHSRAFPPSWLELKHKDFLEDHLESFLVMMDRRYKKSKEKTEKLKNEME